jgi:glucose/arabinose dehydrogenase
MIRTGLSLLRATLQSMKVPLVLSVVAGVVLAGCGGGGGDASGTASVCDPDDGGLTLPDGFCATVVADSVGQPRHLAVADNGDVYAALRETNNGGGAVALRDTDGDYKADRTAFFAEAGGTGIGLRDGHLYFAPDTSVWRYERAAGELVPSGDRETIVSGFPVQDQHAVKPFDFDGNGNLYVNVGAPSNACMEQTRTKGSPGQDPCPLLEEHAGIWRYSATELGQTHTPDARYVSGIRNAVALTWNDAQNNLYAAQHGRDQLHSFFPDLYTQAESAELPAEEFFKADEGDDFGWPYCYYNWMTGQKLLGPEYGGDRETVGRCEQFEDPIQAFPGHWAPNDVLFYDGDQFPEEYRGGAFIAWHGSWNRAPLPQEGFKVTYTPFENGSPAGNFEVFADGFPGVPNPGNAEHRPTGLAVGPDGGLYVADDEGGTIWRVAYVGEEGT